MIHWKGLGTRLVQPLILIFMITACMCVCVCMPTCLPACQSGWLAVFVLCVRVWVHVCSAWLGWFHSGPFCSLLNILLSWYSGWTADSQRCYRLNVSAWIIEQRNGLETPTLPYCKHTVIWQANCVRRKQFWLLPFGLVCDDLFCHTDPFLLVLHSMKNSK